MTKFEPEVAYRILEARQQRYFRRGMDLIFEKSQFWVDGKLTPELEDQFEREITREYDLGASMWDVMNYLSHRIEEEKNDAVH